MVARMYLMTRRTARNQQLPPTEVEYLNSLTIDALIPRVTALYNEGWALQAIGESLSPRRPRSTVRSWVLKAADLEILEVIDAPTVPSPIHKTSAEGYEKRRPTSPGIPEDTFDEIRSLAPMARTFRARMASTSAPAVSNARLTTICKKLHEKGVGIRELAEAAGVTYRAMYKRIKL
jgi:hypothetical protein